MGARKPSQEPECKSLYDKFVNAYWHNHSDAVKGQIFVLDESLCAGQMAKDHPNLQKYESYVREHFDQKVQDQLLPQSSALAPEHRFLAERNLEAYLQGIPPAQQLLACSAPLKSHQTRRFVFLHYINVAAQYFDRKEKLEFARNLVTCLLLSPSHSEERLAYAQHCSKDAALQMQIVRHVATHPCTRQEAVRAYQEEETVKAHAAAGAIPNQHSSRENFHIPNQAPIALHAMDEHISRAETTEDLEVIMEKTTSPEHFLSMLEHKNSLLTSPLLHQTFGSLFQPNISVSVRLALSQHCDGELFDKIVCDPRLDREQIVKLFKLLRGKKMQLQKFTSNQKTASRMIKRFPDMQLGFGEETASDFFSWMLDSKPPKEIKREMLKRINLPEKILSKLAMESGESEFIKEVRNKAKDLNNFSVFYDLASNVKNKQSNEDMQYLIKFLKGAVPQTKEKVMLHAIKMGNVSDDFKEYILSDLPSLSTQARFKVVENMLKGTSKKYCELMVTKFF